jgi:hypothetical protein
VDGMDRKEVGEKGRKQINIQKEQRNGRKRVRD